MTRSEAQSGVAQGGEILPTAGNAGRSPAFTTDRPAVLDIDPDKVVPSAVARGICVEYHHLTVWADGAVIEVGMVLPDMGRPSYAVFGSWLEAFDWATSAARADVLAEIGHDCPRTMAWEYGAACGTWCEVEASCRCSAVPCGGACMCPGGRHADYVAAGVPCASCDPRGTCRQCHGPLGEDNIDDTCGPCAEALR